MKYDFVIIGAGVSGMTSALLLAKHEHRVALVEQFRHPAPTLRGFFRQGVYFDTGLHYTGSFAPGEILDVYFRYLGMTGIERESYNPDGFDRLLFLNNGQEFNLPIGYSRMEAYLGELFPQERKNIQTYLNAVRDDFDTSPFLNLSRSLSFDNLTDIPSNTTLAAYLDSLTDNAMLKSVLSMHCMLYGVPPEETPFTNHAKIVGSYFQSVHGINGGGLSVVRSFEKALKDADVSLFCGSGVKHILLATDGSTRGVELENGQIFEAPKVLCTTHPEVLLDLVPEGAFRPAYRRRIRSLRDTPSAYMLFGIADGPIDSIENRNLYVCPATDVSSFFRPDRHPEQGPFYVASTASAKDNRRGVVAIAPGFAKDAAQWLDSRTGHRPESYSEYKETNLSAVRKALVEAVPELGQVRFVDGATPLTLRDYMQTPTGSLYGSGHSINQFNPVPGTRIPGLLLAGQSVVAPGVLGAVVSAFLTCGYIIGHERIREELITCA
ncbi:MAG: phytoene desaturase family protein [Desulfovibrio sp.]|uniref:phytoene desaturase family protein n=1 Tax=Desulfovibrio sp. 7SRBS1 TaxID=3378064 RepID=UPI003B3EE3E6